MARIEIRWPARTVKRARTAAAMTVLLSLAAGGWTPAAAAGPNTVAQWNKIAEDTVVGSGAFQIEAFVYMAYAQTAVYDALVGIDGTYAPIGPAILGTRGRVAGRGGHRGRV